MGKYIYIQKDTRGIHVEFDAELDGENFRTGATWDDYAAGAWVLLTDEQLAFKEVNPKASVQEVFDMQLTPVQVPPTQPERTLEQARAEKIREIVGYDNGVVNRFIIKIGDGDIPCWFDAERRSTFQTSIGARRRLIAAGMISDETIQLPVNGEIFTLPLDVAEMMLAQLQCYADEAFIVTETHKGAVSQLTDIEGVDAYDFMTGYPEGLRFEI
jgi:hypothetical protein